jgi:uncharacterized membrane protein YphA (DoxX/SURF4 family)
MSKIKFLIDKYNTKLPALWIAMRVVLGFILIISGAKMYGGIKLDFELMLAGLKIPKFFINVIWLTLPWIKLYLGGFLLLGILIRTSAAVAAIFHLLSVFMLYFIKLSKMRIYSHPCSVVSYGNCVDAVIFNIFIVLLSLTVYFFHSSRFSFDAWIKEKGN